MPAKQNKQQKKSKRTKPNQARKQYQKVRSKRAKRQNVTVKKFTQLAMMGQDRPADIRNLALQIALPGTSTPMRVPTVDMPRTSVAFMRDQFSVQTTGTSATVGPPGFKAGDTLFVLHGQPGRFVSVYCNPMFSNAAIYSCNFSGGNRWIFPVESQVYDDQVFWPLTNAVSTASGPHGYTMPIGQSKGVPYVFLDSGDSISLLGGTFWGTMIGTAKFAVRRWMSVDDPPTEMARFNVTIATAGTSATAAYTSGLAGYYSLAFVGFVTYTSGVANVQLPISVNTTIGATSGRWHLLSMSDLDPNNGGDINLCAKARLTSSALLLTNTTSVLNRQGTVLAARLRTLDSLEVTALTLAKAAEKYTGDAAKGVYTFTSFSEAKEQFADHHTVVAGTSGSNGLQFDLDFDDYYHYIQISSNTTQPNNFTMSLMANIEFQVDIARYSKAAPTLQHGALIEARRLINTETEWFYENPLHMAQIYGFLKSGARALGRGLTRLAPYAAAVGSVANPAMAGAYSGLASAFQNLGFD